MTTTLFRGALACALSTSTALTAPALAQSAPPVAHNIDENGVDLVLGTFNFRQRLVSIGPDGQNGLDYVRMLNEGRWLDNATGGVFQTGGEVSVSFGDTSAVFVFSGGPNVFNPGTYSPKRADGSTLTRSGGTFSFTNAAGTIVRFTAAINSSGRIVEGTGRLVDLRYPSGMLISFNHRTETVCDEFGQNCAPVARVQSVTNSANYQLHFTYAQDSLADAEDYPEWHRLTSVRAINTAVEACDAFADNCTLANAWPSAAFGTSGSDETVTLPDGNVWRFTPGGPGPSAIRRPGATSDDVSISYDSLGLVQSVAGAAGTWTYGYSDSGSIRTTSVSGPLSASRTVVSDLDHLTVTSDQDALGRTTAYQYDGSDRMTQITAPEGNYAAYAYDGRGNATQTQFVPKSGSGAATLTLSASFPSSCTNALTCNHPTSVTDARGNTTDFTYDSSHGGILTATAPAPTTGATRPQSRFSYTQVTAVTNQPVYMPTGVSACQSTSSCSGGSDEAIAAIGYDNSNLLATSVSRGNGSGTLTATSALAYDDIGNLQSVDGPLSGTADTIRLRYNGLRQTVGAIGPDPDGAGALEHRAVRTVYDAAGLPTAVDRGTVNSQSDGDWSSISVLESTATERDDRGRPVVQRLVSGGTTYALTQMSYDARGRPQCVAQRMNSSEFATASLPSDACTLDTEGSFGPDRIVRTTYDAADQVTLVQTGYGVSGVQADEVATTYSSNGRVATATDAEGNRTSYVYDGFDRLARTRMPDPATPNTSSTTDYEELGYDPNGNVVSRLTRGGWTFALGYDALNRLIVEDGPGYAWGEVDHAYGYDNLGRMVSASDDFGVVLTFGYDALGRRLSETSNVDGAIAASQYDLAGQRTRLTWRDGLYIAYDYNAAGDMTHIRENGAASGAGVLAAYAYDDLGRRTSLTRGNGTSTAYAYDPVSRLASLSEDLAGSGYDLILTFAYNPAGQIASRANSNHAYSFAPANANVADTVNGLNQVTATGGTSVSHDNRGNVSAIGSSGYTYTAANLLTVAPGGNYAYDPLGRLWRGTAYAGGYHHDGASLIMETYYVTGAITRRFVHGPGIDEPLVWYEGADLSDRRFLHADERGSIVALTNDAGTLIGLNRYDDYGAPQSGALTGRFGYTGQIWLPELGMHNYRARIYNPGLGRFMQTDPIGFGGGMNLYAYVGNDPVNFTDPLGLQQTVTVTGPAREEPGDPGREPGFRKTDSMVAGSIISENPQEITITALPRVQRAQRILPRVGPILPFFTRPPTLPFPFPRNPLRPPAPGWQWRGNGPPGSGRGNWYNPQTGESLHPDLHHPPPVRPHYDYRAPDGSQWRWYPDNTWELKTIVI